MRRRRRASNSARGGAVAEINITPMVDVLLCLLILVMVIQPGLLKGVDVQVPLLEGAGRSMEGVRDDIILQVAPGPVYTINHQPVVAAQLPSRLAQVFAPRERKVLFVAGAEDATYEDVVAAVDVARGAGIRVIGLVAREGTSESSTTHQTPPSPGHSSLRAARVSR